MKGIVYFIFLLSSYTLVAQLPNTSMGYQDLFGCPIEWNGRVIRIEEEERNYYTDYRQKNKYTFHENGKLKQLERRRAITDYRYDAQGKLVGQVTRSKRRNILQDSIVGRYDKKGRLQHLLIYTGEKKQLKSLDQIFYSRKNRIKKIIKSVVQYSELSEVRWLSANRVVLKSFVSEAGDLKAYRDTILLDEETQCYPYSERVLKNVKGQRMVEIKESPLWEEGGRKMWVEYLYDAQGNIIKEIGYDFYDKNPPEKKEKIYQISREITYKERL